MMKWSSWILRIFPKNISGFSLIELSIVVLVASVMAASSLNFISKKGVTTKMNATEEKLITIKKAIKVYVDSKGYLPRPAPFNVTPKAATFGQGSNNTGDYSGSHTATNESNVVAGSVPVIDLGLPPNFAFDEWGRRISYVIDKDMDNATKWGNTTVSNIVLRTRAADDSLNDLLNRTPKTTELGTNVADCRDYYDSTPTDITVAAGALNTLIPVCPALLLISHGPNGSGARDAIGNKWVSAVNIGDDEKENAVSGNSIAGQEFDNIFIKLDSNSVDTSSTNNDYFDDVIIFATKEELKR